MNTELDVDGAVLILNGATSVGAGSSGSMPAGGIVIVEAYGTTSSGTGSAIIQIQVSNNGTTWQTAGTINLNLKNTRTSDTFTMDDSWSSWTYLRANLASISGTGASVYVYKNAGLSQGLAAELAASQFVAQQQPFVIGGQSNADGRGSITNPSPSHPSIFMLDKGENYRIATEPLGAQVSGWINNIPGGGPGSTPAHSFGVEMGKVLARETGIVPLLVPCAIGSTTFEQWLQPALPLDISTLFGALILRAQKAAQRTGQSPIFVWYGHESNSSDTVVDLATGSVGYAFLWKMDTLIRQVRAYFPNAPFLYAQLSTANSGVEVTRFAYAGESQRRAHDTGGTYTEVATLVAPQVSSVDATNTITSNSPSNITMQGDGGTPLTFYYSNFTIGKAYEIAVTVTGTGLFKITSGSTPYSNQGAGTYVYAVTAGATTIGFSRQSPGQPTNLTFNFSYIRALNGGQITNAYMAVTHDVPRNAGADNIHLSDIGQKEVGRRFALLYAEKVLKLPGIDGLGPRLVSVTSTDATHTKVKFSQNIAAAKAGETNYGDGTDSLFRVYDAGVEKSVTTVAIDGADATALIITHASCSGVRVVSYGDRAGQDAQWRKGVVYNTTSPLPLPAPAFIATSV
jgi:hypothetical protein